MAISSGEKKYGTNMKFKATWRDFCGIAFFGFFLVVGSWALTFGLMKMNLAIKAKGWPTTQGTIISSSMSSQSNPEEGGGTQFSAHVRYEYEVNGKIHSGSRVTAVELSYGDSGIATKILNKYPVGKSVDVYYHETNPDTALLEPGVHFSEWFLIICGLAFLTPPFGVGFLLYKFRDTLAQTESENVPG